jgi:hypothetical protein
LVGVGLRISTPKPSMLLVTQCNTLRLRLIKIAARVVELKTILRVHLPKSYLGKEVIRFGRAPGQTRAPSAGKSTPKEAASEFLMNLHELIFYITSYHTSKHTHFV